MDFPRGFTARKCDRTSDFVLENPCSTYQTPYISPSPHGHDSSTIPRHKSLPSIHSRMYFARSSPKRAVKRERSDSTNSLRRSVSGMKSLLPLKLSSSLPTSTSTFPPPPQRSTFGFEEHSPDDALSRSAQLPERCRPKVPRPLTIRREQYRDTPVYTEPGSPQPNLVYTTEEELCLDPPPAESSDEFLIFDRYTSSSSERDDLEDLDDETPLPDPLLARTRRRSRSSDLSFKCLGESKRPLFRDEGAWLCTPLNRSETRQEDLFPHFMEHNVPAEHDIEEWSSASDTSSECDEDEGSYACATALAPAKAHVVDVNTPQLSFKIPPRSTSLAGTRPQSFTSDDGRNSMALRESYMTNPTYHPWIGDGITENWLSQPPLPLISPDLAMATPPLSPTQTASWRNRKPVGLGIAASSDAYPEELSGMPASDSITQILKDLSEAISNFPSDMLLPETPCIRAIRIQLEDSRHSRWDQPAPPLSPFSEGVDWRPRPNGSPRRPSTSLQRNVSSRTSKSVPLTKQDWRQDALETPLCFQNHPPIPPFEPNLQPLAATFPNAPQELHSALYAHILAYLFVASLPDHHLLPHNHTPPPSPSYLLPFFSTKAQSLPAKAADRLGITVPPFFSTAPNSLPPKAAARLGITITPDRPQRNEVSSDNIIVPHAVMENGIGVLLERVKARIGLIIAKMGDDEQARGRGMQMVDIAFLRALGEIVKGCERECFGVLRF